MKNVSNRYSQIQTEALVKSYIDFGNVYEQEKNYSRELQSNRRALDIATTFFGEEHESTADSYIQFGITQYNMHEYSAAVQSHQRALAIRIKLFGEEHESTTHNYRQLGVTQNKMHDDSAALQCHQLDCKTVRIFAYSSTREQSNKRCGTRLKTESKTRESTRPTGV